MKDCVKPRRCALVSDASDVLAESAVLYCQSSCAQACSDCGSVYYVFHALFDACKCDVYGVFLVVECSLCLLSRCSMLCEKMEHVC